MNLDHPQAVSAAGSASPGIASFLAQADGVGRLLVMVLVAMSMATWYLILTRSVQGFVLRRRIARFLAAFRGAGTPDDLAAVLRDRRPAEPFSRLARHGLQAATSLRDDGSAWCDAAGGAAEWIARALRRVIDEETARIEAGLTLLATVGSTAPFVGLFGTVWGVYRALTAIGLSGQGTLDQVAGPVGEALIMTAAGLAVAIPAVVAYNTFVRGNRLMLARLDSFAHDLFATLTAGSPAPVAVRSMARRMAVDDAQGPLPASIDAAPDPRTAAGR